MHPGILSTGIENGGHWPWPWRSFRPFSYRNSACHDNFNGFELKLPNLHQMCILGFPQLVLKMSVIDLDLQGHLAISTQNFRKQNSTSLLYMDLGRPRGVTRPNMLLCFIYSFIHSFIYLFIHLFICLLFIHYSFIIYLFIYLSFVSFCLFICSFIYSLIYFIQL